MLLKAQRQDAQASAPHCSTFSPDLQDTVKWGMSNTRLLGLQPADQLSRDLIGCVQTNLHVSVLDNYAAFLPDCSAFLKQPLSVAIHLLPRAILKGIVRRGGLFELRLVAMWGCLCAFAVC